MRLLLVLLLVLSPTVSTAGQNAANILVLGDSISAAYGLAEDAGWVALLQAKLQKNHYSFNIVNASISGETSAGGANRIDALLAKNHPVVVILELGGNDGLRGLSLKSMQQNLRQIIVRSQQKNAQVLLLGMRIPPNYGQRYTAQFGQIYRQLARQHGLAFHPFFLKDVAESPQLMQADGIHPTADAQQPMLNQVWPVLKPLLQ